MRCTHRCGRGSARRRAHPWGGSRAAALTALVLIFPQTSLTSCQEVGESRLKVKHRRYTGENVFWTLFLCIIDPIESPVSPSKARRYAARAEIKKLPVKLGFDV